jgi:hypothetical protein
MVPFGHQATYNKDGGLILSHDLAAGTADRFAPYYAPGHHYSADVETWMRAARLDGNPFPAAVFEWDLDGDGSHGTSLSETDTTPETSVRYMTYPSAISVQLDQIPANRRMEYNLSTIATGGFVLERRIRVALGTHQGTPLTGVTPAQRNAEVQLLAPAPAGMDVVPLAVEAGYTATYGLLQRINADPLAVPPTPPKPSSVCSARDRCEWRIPIQWGGWCIKALLSHRR